MENQNQQKESIVNLFKKISEQMENFQQSRTIINSASEDTSQDKRKQFVQLQKQFYENQQRQIEQTLKYLKHQNETQSIFCMLLNFMQNYLKKINLMIKTQKQFEYTTRKMFDNQLNRLKNEYQKKDSLKQDYYSQLLKEYQQKCETIEQLKGKILSLQTQLNNIKQNSIDQTLTKKIAQSNPQINVFLKQTFTNNQYKNVCYELQKQSQKQNNAKKTLNLIKKILSQNNYEKQSQSSINSSRITDFFQVKDSIIRQSNQISHKKYFEFVEIKQQSNIKANKQKSSITNQTKQFVKQNCQKQVNQTQKLQSISNFLARKSIFSKSTLNEKQSRTSIMNKHKGVSQIKSIIM